MNLSSQIEAYLFYTGAPTKKSDIIKALSLDTAMLETALGELSQSLAGRGVALVLDADSIALVTSPEVSELIERLRKEELTKDVGRAGLEVFSIVLYSAPVSRAEIEYIRGVNSSFIIRALLVRGLIARKNNPNDSRSFLYIPTLEALTHLGVSEITELPEYEKIKNELAAFLNTEDTSNEHDV